MGKNLHIKSVDIENFRNHEKLSISLGDFNVIIGENGGGKTSVLEAISFALFGASATKLTKGELVRYGCKNTTVTLTLSDDSKIIRDFASGCQLIGSDESVITEKSGEIENYLGMSPRVFQNILYASQNDVYSYFINFNAKEKDFLDDIFNLDAFNDSVIQAAKDALSEINNRRREIKSAADKRNVAEKTISEILKDTGTSSEKDLERSMEIAADNLRMARARQNKYNENTTLLNQRYAASARISESRKRLEELKKIIEGGSVDKIKEDYEKIVNMYFQRLEMSGDPYDMEEFYDRVMREKCNLGVLISRLKEYVQEALRNQDNQKIVIEKLAQVKNVTEDIMYIDSMLEYIRSMRSRISSMKRRFDAAEKEVSDSKSEMKRTYDILKNSENKLVEIEGKIAERGGIESIENLTDVIANYTRRASSLEEKLKAIRYAKKSIDGIPEINEDEFLKLEKAEKEINAVMPLFGRDGFKSFMRRSILREIANSIGNSIDQFGFLKLMPVAINEKTGALTFNDRAFRSLSGGEKTIVAILLRILYAKVLIPNMRLGVFMLDEPTADLDSIRVNYLRSIITQVNEGFGIQVIVVTHDETVIPEGANVVNISTLK